MSDKPAAEPPDPGLFLKHYRAGKQAYEAGRLEEAERELEEAYLLRPREPKILNLLGLLYFKKESYQKAEEVYRKLAAESPEAHTLFYNLGLIYLKLNRPDDAELAFLKALELSRENPKIHFYLGSIYERQRRFQDAIFQYRQAGAGLMARRIEDRLQPGQSAGGRPGDDTAEYEGDPPGGARPIAEPPLVPAKPLQPVSDVLLADGAPRPGDPPASPGPAASPPAPAPARADARTLPPDTAPAPAEPTLQSEATGTSRPTDIVAFLASLPAHTPKEKTGVTGVSSAGTGIFTAAVVAPPVVATPPPRPAEAFRLLQRNLMEVVFAGKVFVKQGTIYSYTGKLTFWVKEKRTDATPALVIVTGTGKLLLTDRDREIQISSVEGRLCVRPTALLACEESLTPRFIRLGQGGTAPEFLEVEGNGTLAVSLAGRPLNLTVTPGQPVAVAASSVILWSGSLEAAPAEDEGLQEALLAPGAPVSSLIRLEGTGHVLVERGP